MASETRNPLVGMGELFMVRWHLSPCGAVSLHRLGQTRLFGLFRMGLGPVRLRIDGILDFNHFPFHPLFQRGALEQLAFPPLKPPLLPFGQSRPYIASSRRRHGTRGLE